MKAYHDDRPHQSNFKDHHVTTLVKLKDHPDENPP